jgi:hypothetical protein
MLAFANAGLAQCDSFAEDCDEHFSEAYISDGQEYRALLHSDQTAVFESTLFGSNTYRIAACSGKSNGNLIFSIYDQEGNLIFTNEEYSNAPYWDFAVSSTVNVTIEAHLDPNKSESGCAVLLIGFKK